MYGTTFSSDLSGADLADPDRERLREMLLHQHTQLRLIRDLLTAADGSWGESSGWRGPAQLRYSIELVGLRAQLTTIHDHLETALNETDGALRELNHV